MYQNNPHKNQKKKRKENLNDVAKYSTMSFQMIAIILLGVFGGKKLDTIIHIEFPIFTVVLTIVSVILSVYFAIKDLIRFNK